ncbi:MAG: N,N'-diacetylchitobiose phosphorylase [Treponemataceae bacterium]|nr:N,N'-diacetylchitobiose phosphorylase [Treponemataceae bacterium]
MNYGYFDDQAREYVITRPDTPQSWSNYLGSTQYGAVITNNAGGYGFFKSGARGRFMRLRFNSVPMDQPGRYFYLRDNDNADFWSASWQPVGKSLDSYKSTCRHGTAYTTITSDYSDIATETTYFVPLNQNFEYWMLKVTNNSDKPRNLSVFSYCELTNQWNTTQDQVNLQYSIFINQGWNKDNIIGIDIQKHMEEQNRAKIIAAGGDPDAINLEGDVSMNTWLALIGANVDGFDTDRNSFIGTYGGYHAPKAVTGGKCSNSCAYGDNSCGSFQTNITLAPGESKELAVMLGIGSGETVGKKTVARFGSIETAKMELEALKKDWHNKLNSLSVNTPDEDINHTVNMWGLYNCLITFAWSRAASLIYNGERDGFGFRDSVQDILGVSAAIPEVARDRLVLMLSGQLSHGGAVPVINPVRHEPGKVTPTPAEELRSDDCLWFFNSIPCYVSETGDFDFYNKVIPYADKGSATVLEHLKQALLFNLERSGSHGLPCGLSADWNDCLRLGYRGESLFVAFQLRLGFTVYADICRRMGKNDEADWADARKAELDANIQKHCWDGNWFIWAIAEDGTVYGTKTFEEGQVYFNTQVWAVLSGAATPEQAQKAMQTVKDKLATPYGLMLCAPPFAKTTVDVMRAVVFNKGIKENAGIFNHTQGWGIIAETMLGNGDRAYEYCKAALPASYNDKAEIRQAEPYVQCQTTYSIYSPRPGTARVSWLSGAATWSYYSVTQYILGIHPVYEGLMIDPCIPTAWDGFTAERRFRGCNVKISVKNPAHHCKGIAKLTVNGKEISGNTIPAEMLTAETTVEAIIG